MQKAIKNCVLIFLLFFQICLIQIGKAQLNDIIPADFSFVKNSQIWINSENATGLHHFLHAHASTANISYNLSKGNFIDYYQSNNSRNWKVETESFNRLNEKIVFYGLINYQNFSGQNMGGSAFINPYETPFNFVEYADTNKGEKNKESYCLIGGLSYALTNKLFVSGKIDYNAANYAKQKDLRHKNKLLDLSLSLGLSYIFKKLELGLNYFYHRNIEEITFRTFGNTDLQYMMLIDYGNFYGETELYDRLGNGFIHGTGLKPLFTEIQGGAFQFSILLGKHWKWLNEIKLRNGDGYFGKEGTHSVLYTVHDVKEWNYQTILQKSTDKSLQNIKISGGNKKLNNYRNVINYVSIPGEIEDVMEIVKTRRLQRSYWHASLSYDGYFAIKQLQPKWHMNSQIKYYTNSQKTHLFPFYREQDINYYQIDASIERNITKNKKHWWLRLGSGYGEGFGTKNNDYQSGSTSSEAPRTTELNLNRTYEYNTLPRLYGYAQIKYGISSYASSLIYIALNYTYTKGFNSNYLKSAEFHEIKIKLGLEF